MKKVLIATAIVAAGAGAYIFTQQQNSSAGYNVLDYVPADTPLFSAQLEPFPLKDYLSSTPALNTTGDLQALNELYDNGEPAVNFLLNLFKTYQENLQDPDLFIQTFGLPEKLRGYFYTLGLFPVLKLEVESPQAIWDLLDKNELETGFTHQKGTLQSIDYRIYPLTDKNAPTKLELIVAIDRGLLTVMLNGPDSDPSLLANALGLNKPEKSLAASGKIKEIITAHHFQPASIGFINHVELLKGLTTTDGNQLSRQIASLEKQFNQESPLAVMRSPTCNHDFASISQNWPQTVFGYTNLSVTDKESTLEMSAIVESKNQPILTALQTLRGYIPEYTADMSENVLAIGLGIDVNQLSDSLTNIWTDLQSPTYTCQPLAEVQNQIGRSGASIGMLGMGVNLAKGIKGISFGILDYAMGQLNNQPTLDSLDAIFTISAENPLQIFQSLQMFTPELQRTQLSDGSEPIDLNRIIPIPAELNLNPKLAIKGKHLVIYNGDKGQAAANALTLEPLSANGLNRFSFDFKKVFTPFVTALELSGETMPEEALFLSEYNARVKMTVDINPQGLIFSSYINTKAAQ